MAEIPSENGARSRKLDSLKTKNCRFLSSNSSLALGICLFVAILTLLELSNVVVNLTLKLTSKQSGSGFLRLFKQYFFSDCKDADHWCETRSSFQSSWKNIQ